MPPNYRQPERTTVSLAERKGAIAIAALTLACAIGLGSWELSNGFGSQHPQKCVTATVGGPTGGGIVQGCGSQRSAWCKTESTYPGEIGKAVTAACRKAGYLTPD